MFSFDMVVTLGALFRCDMSQRECVGRMIKCAQRTATRVADVQECTKNGSQGCLNWCHADTPLLQPEPFLDSRPPKLAPSRHGTHFK